MAIQKQLKGAGSHTLVTFTIFENEADNLSKVSLVGDFNNWQEDDSSYQMEKKGNSFAKSLKLENGKRYEFRYLTEDSRWFNDAAADDYVASPYHGIENAVVDLSALPKKATKAAKVAKTPKTVKATKKSKKDDLKKIEGIGPKIASILAKEGIDTFKKLSESPVKILETILKEAGSRYSIHKPNSWPKQAKLAYEGKWDALQLLQDKLDGGK